MTSNWELALIAVVEKELEQLKWLITCEKAGTDDIERQDVHAQISRLGGLTDLADLDALPLSETSTAKLHRCNETAMRWVREGISEN